MTTLSDKIRAFMKENEAELSDNGIYGSFEDILVDIASQENEDEDRGQMQRTIAEVRYENREM